MSRVCVPRGRKYNYKSECEGGGEGGSRLSVNMRGGRKGEEERMLADKKERIWTLFMPVSGSGP